MAFTETKRKLFSKAETTPGTNADPIDRANSFASPVKQDVRIRSLSFDPGLEFDDENSKFLTGDFTGDEAIPGMSPGSIEFGIKFAPGELGGSVGAYTHKLPYAKYLTHSALSEFTLYDTANAATLADYAYAASRVYIPTIAASSNTMTHTVVDVDGRANVNANAYEFNGSMANLTITAEKVGAPWMFNFSGQGGSNIYSVPYSAIAGLAFDDAEVLKTVADTFLNTTITIKNLTDNTTSTVCVKSMTHDGGVQLAQTDCQDTENGILYFEASQMQPRVTVQPQLIPVSDFGFWAGMKETKKYEITVTSKYKTATGPVVLQLYYPRCQILSSTISEDSAKLYNELVFRPIRNVDKSYPVVTYLDNTDGITEITWDGSDVPDAQKAEATWYLIIGEVTA